jgi:hypothetical protein
MWIGEVEWIERSRNPQKKRFQTPPSALLILNSKTKNGLPA